MEEEEKGKEKSRNTKGLRPAEQRRNRSIKGGRSKSVEESERTTDDETGGGRIRECRNIDERWQIKIMADEWDGQLQGDERDGEVLNTDLGDMAPALVQRLPLSRGERNER